MMKHLISAPILLLSILIMILPSCSDTNDGTGIPANAIFDMVTFSSQTPAGAVFTLQREQTSPELTLVAANQQVNTELFPIGCRMIIAYTNDSGDINKSGNITLYGGGMVKNGKVEVKSAEETDNFHSDLVRLTSVWLTGNYLNFELQVDCTIEPTTYTIYADEATLDTDNPTLYLILKADDPGTSYWQQTYASFDISSIWLSGAERFTVVVNDNNFSGETTKKTFLKNPDTTID